MSTSASNVINAKVPPIRDTLGKMPTMLSPTQHQEQSHAGSSLKQSARGISMPSYQGIQAKKSGFQGAGLAMLNSNTNMSSYKAIGTLNVDDIAE